MDRRAPATAVPRLVPLAAPDARAFVHPAFAPYAHVLARFASAARFPGASELNEHFAPHLDQALGTRSVRFEHQRGRRRGPLASLDDAYEARIDARGLVPTRACLHDFANALVWSRFPRSKRALAARQHAALRRDVPVFTGALPNARSEERDVLAMLDEGALVTVGEGGVPVVFGHAILEHLASSPLEIRALPVVLDACTNVDEALAAMISAPANFRVKCTPSVDVRAAFERAVQPSHP